MKLTTIINYGGEIEDTFESSFDDMSQFEQKMIQHTKAITKVLEENGTPAVGELDQELEKERKLPKGKRVVRTKSSGDRVYLIDEEKETRQWVTNPKVLEALGFTIADVKEIEDSELLKYNMAAALYKV